MEKWKHDKEWSDRFLPEIKKILESCLINEDVIKDYQLKNTELVQVASEEDDQMRNTDLVVFKMDVLRIGCRVRSFGYFEKYKHQFTIRSKRPSGALTELDKIVAGWGHYLFYGFCDEDERKLTKWTLINLTHFRLWLYTCLSEYERHPGLLEKNIDSSSEFRAFVMKITKDISKFPLKLVVPKDLIHKQRVSI